METMCRATPLESQYFLYRAFFVLSAQLEAVHLQFGPGPELFALFGQEKLT